MSGVRGKKRIAFDAQPLLSNSKSGVGFHEDGLVQSLMHYYNQDEYLFDYFAWKNRKIKKEKIIAYINQENIIANECRWFPGSLYRMLWGVLPIPYKLFFGKKADITHFFNFCIPPGVYGKKVVTIHDMALHRFPYTIRLKTKIMLKLNLNKSIKCADAIIAVSEFTKSEIQKFYNVSPEKIYVVPNGVDVDKFHANYTEQNKMFVKEKYGIKGEYFLYMGNVEPRKNLSHLIKAYIYAQKECKGIFPKLIIGGAKGWLCEEIYQLVEKNNDCIKIIGYVGDEDVPILMSAAKVFCYVSLYEGFGMPVLEAMACGTPVLTSNTSALKEVAGDAAVQVNPMDVTSITNGLLELYNNKELRDYCKQQGVNRARNYSWEKAAHKLYEVYETVLNEDKRKQE